jgi:serine/threonine protein phosphatase 1
MLTYLTEKLRLRRAPAPDSAATPRVPEDSLVIAIGDVHGRLDLLTALEARIVEYARTRPEPRRLLVYLGDYIDRGYQSRQVVDHLVRPPPAGFERVCLLGNHEEFLLRFVELPADGSAWLANGGRETLMSYGVNLPTGAMLPDDIARARGSLLAQLPEVHLDFLRDLVAYHVEGDYLFVHAGVRPGRSLTDQRLDDLLWIREEFLDSNANHGYVVVHGHTVVDDPDIRPNRIGIDTGAYASGRLTALALAGAGRDFLRS